MVAIGRSSHAYFFDGVSDSIIIPQGRFRKTGTGNTQGNNVSINVLEGSDDETNINGKDDVVFIIETFVIPDCGGVIASRDNQFTLEMGTVDTPGPAKFSLAIESSLGQSFITLTTAFDKSTRWDGIVFPQQDSGGIHDSFNRYDSGLDEATNLNFKNRPLYHVVAGLKKGKVFLNVNGVEVASQSVTDDTRVARSTGHVYVGGKGGEFRGAIEALHMTSQYNDEMLIPQIPVKTKNSTALFRFEEPIDIIEESYSFSAFTAASNGTTTTLTIPAADAQALIARLTGKAYDSSSPTTDFRASPYSMGNYKVTDYYTTPTSPTTIASAHTPYNLLINPGAINRNSHKPNQSPPERVRLHSINGSTGVITVSSIHIDFVNGTNGLRGLLHSRTADVDNYFVVIGADLLIDNGTGKPYQPPHYGTQIFDKTGQMTVDESDFENHGLVYSSRMATTTSDPENPFAVNWPATLDELFQVGHSGRHLYSHITGHEFMRRFPKPTDMIIDQQIDGSADIVEMVYENSTQSIQDMFVMNGLVDFYNNSIEAPIARIKNSSTVASIVNNGLPASKKELIAIGGSGFDYAPFMLKGPVPEFGDINDTTRLYHLVPESQSRIALLHVPALKSTYNYAPFVEIHYNAIDLTGASMSISGPMLMVEKTVPASNHIVTGSTRILDVITADLANTTLYSAGGVITLTNAIDGYGANLQDSHTLIGDNTGGQESDIELDYSTTPALYTPDNDVSATPASPPKAIARSHNNAIHESVYHKLTIEARSPAVSNNKTDSDGIGNTVLQPLTEKSGTGVFDIGPTTTSSRYFEIFDIIDNVRIYDEQGIFAKIFVQPSNKLRSNQLSLISTAETHTVPNIASLMILMSRCRIRGVKNVEDVDTNGLITSVIGKGIADSFVNENVSAIGSGSPDSHIVKEIEPNSPVVTVNLGGPGQGAVNTKPTFDPSPLMRLPGSTRRNCVVQAIFVDTDTSNTHQTISVKPLNNESPDMKSWGTICFPKVGRIFLEDGASAEYSSRVGAGFLFDDTDSIAERKYLDAAGRAYSTLHAWLNGTNVLLESVVGSYAVSFYISNDADFDNSNLTQDGSTVNDRLFQTLSDVNHDYQLGTQYASTRAMVEIPVFPKQFFDHTAEGIFPGPDNSMKLHIDATYTAHTWNPSPVGRRAKDVEATDKEVFSAYSYNVQNKNYVDSATITKVEEASNEIRISVSHPHMFPSAAATEDSFGNLEARLSYKRVFLASGDWGVYKNDPTSNGYIAIPKVVGGGYENAFTKNFKANATVGSKIFITSGINNQVLVPVSGGAGFPSSDFEGRSNFYHDSANVQTQGGNIDYGLRQYVSAVEFKAGPLTNPHAPRVESKRAEATIVNAITSGSTRVLTLDDSSLFPEVPYSRNSTNGIEYQNGDLIYVAEIDTDTPTEVYYLGVTFSNSVSGENQFVIQIPSGTTLNNPDMIGKKIYLKKAGHSFKAVSDPTNADVKELRRNLFEPSSNPWSTPVTVNAGSTTKFCITNSQSFVKAGANTISTNIRKGDKLFGVYRDTATFRYLGEVSAVTENTYSPLTNFDIALCTVTNSSPVITVSSTSNIVVGMAVSGNGIQSNTHVLTVDSGTQITLDKDATGLLSSPSPETLSFEVEGAIIKLTSNIANQMTSVLRINVLSGDTFTEDFDAVLNRSWLFPYAQGGLRNGDTVWMNMTLNNPYAIEGLFCKSRGVLNEGLVWSGFNGGKGALSGNPRDSIPLENFLIGNTCLETAQNFAQHINKTIELNYEAFGLDATQAPTIAYVDPYLATDGNARVLLYDVAHDREFIAFHDIHMQVQSSASTPTIGFTKNIAYEGGTGKLDKILSGINGNAPHYLTTQIDVMNGYPSENRFIRRTQQSKFIESAYAHNIPSMTSKDLTQNTGGTVDSYNLKDPATSGNNNHRKGKGHGHFVHTGIYHEETSDTHNLGDSVLPRVEPAVASLYWAVEKHKLVRKTIGENLLLQQLREHRLAQNPATHSLRDTSTMFDTPDGTRVISAFLCLKGKRNTALDLTNHEETRLQHLKHWTEMDFVRRMTVDMGEIGVKEGVTDIEAAAREIVRVINQGGALNGRTHARRPSQQYPGESERLDLTRIGVRADILDENKDPSSAHINADFAATGSTHDPSPFWDENVAFETHDRGSHMGYVRAHLGRVVEDINGNEGFSVVIHSTVPGASGRNFCVWLDNSKGQSNYQPQFLIGHGGRFRNFWAQPDETTGENMHPAPMPLNKHGRPFAPITTLREMVIQDRPDEAFASNHDIAPRRDNVSNPIQRNLSAHIGGISQNTVNDESFESQSPSMTLVKGLRAGNQAVGRINFGGLVASGVPGFSPIAGKHGFGRKGSTDFDKIYNEAIKKGTSGAAGTDPTAITSYSTHVPSAEVTEDSIGNSTLFGVRFTDHRGRGYGVRYIYRQLGKEFANELTTIPSTIDEEVCIYFDDSDVSQGGFTIGQHMLGWGDVTGRMDISGLHASEGEKSWRGNQWRGVPAPDVGIDCYIQWNSTTLTLTLEAPFDTGNLANHPDILGYLGFPKENGVIQLTDPFTNTSSSRLGSTGTVISYTSRTTEKVGGTHQFFGVIGPNDAVSHSLSAATSGATFTETATTYNNNQIHRLIITPRLNWTTLITDEIIAVATAHAINLQNPNIEEGLSFDCRDFYAADGRTLGEWGVSPDAIKIRAHNPQRGAVPLSTMFSATVHKDLGIEAPHLEYGEYKYIDKSTLNQWTINAPDTEHKPVSDANIDKNRKAGCGYLPRTILQIRSKSRGYHSNTPTPVVVDSYNDPINITNWKNNLTGINYTSVHGDHILPKLDNGIVQFSDYTGATTHFTIPTAQHLTHMMKPAGQESATQYSKNKILSFGSSARIWFSDEAFATATSKQGSTSMQDIQVLDANSVFLEKYATSDDADDGILMLHGDKQFTGYRLYGSVESKPVVHFMGGRDSIDHSVPLYFGGGFSGVVLDINDGTQNDYSSFYTHPYSTGPTGTAGIQNANEISTSFAILDCNAMLAFFPGTPFLNQHRGSVTPPAHNKNNILSPDLMNETYSRTVHRPAHLSARYTAGVVPQKAVPMVIRLPHQNARYRDYVGDDVVDGKYFTTYLVFGPGQAFPFTSDETDSKSDREPHPGSVVTTGNGWSKVPFGVNLPNEIKNSDGIYGPPSSTYQSRRNRFQYHTTLNWSPAEGIPNIGDGINISGSFVAGYGLMQRPEHGYHYGEHFVNPTSNKVTALNEPDYKKAHPYQHCSIGYYGIAMSADMTWHMDGGYHPGGSWLDQQMSFNPPMEKGNYRVFKEAVNTVHPTAFRASGCLHLDWVVDATTDASEFFRDTILVDATRCQNGEELATIIGQAINENPGRSALKALGGTFMPSMGTSIRQDRYGWIELDYVNYNLSDVALNEANVANLNTTSSATTFSNAKSYVLAKLAIGNGQVNLEKIPASGWIRTDLGGRLPSDPTGTDAPTFGCYHSREVIQISGTWHVLFHLAPNRISGMPVMEDITTWDNKCDSASNLSFPDLLGTGALNPPTKVYVWSKSGVHTYMNNTSDKGNLFHKSSVHFNGLVDAIDRTRPVGAVGWAGERYSYLNTLKIGSSNVYAAGLGAWHPKLGFSPYGKASSVMSTFGHLPNISPLKYAPESTGPINGRGGADAVLSSAYSWNTGLASTDALYSGYAYESAEDSLYGNKPVTTLNNGVDVIESLHSNQGVFGRAFLVISYEGELPLIAKRDRDGITATGDWLAVRSKVLQSVDVATALTFAGNTQWSADIHSADRFVAPANGGPNIEALIPDGISVPTADYATSASNSAFTFNSTISADSSLKNAEPCLHPTGDLFFDLDESPGSIFLNDNSNVERNRAIDFLTGTGMTRYAQNTAWGGATNVRKLMLNTPTKNFSVEHVVWKRMDGGNLSLPASNARGLGAIPFTTRVNGGNAFTMGEELLGNNRFSFETTNSAMFPILQAQELSHPQLATQHPDELRNALMIPNEEIQFEEIIVTDDTGQTHIIEGGSPFGTIIRTYNTVSDRGAEGLAPSIANSGIEPNLKIRLPDPETIPGNIIIRPGFGALQAYQTETIGSGGMMRPISSATLKHLFTDETTGPRLGPTFSDHNWEHISQAATGEAFPDSTYKGWEITTGNAPLETSYELHDRTLYFHITKNGNTHSHRHPNYYTHAAGAVSNELTAVSYSGTTLTVNTAPSTSLYDETVGPGDTRKFLRLYDPTTGKGGVASFTGIASSTFTGCVGDADFQEIIKGDISSYKVVPSYYIPAGSTRFFAARRLRDHAEVSGNSPDTAHMLYFNYFGGAEEQPKSLFRRPRLSPLAAPRMGHHFVNPTMAMLPGHWAHPAYQGLYNKHLATRSATLDFDENLLMKEQNLNDLKSSIETTLTDKFHAYDVMHKFSALSATPSGPSDIHGGAFTLMFETKIKTDGYGILASEGQAGVINAAGGHTIVLEAAANYTLDKHFPDPSEVGAYQVIIQPNIHKSQLMGYHANGPANDLPNGSVNELTSQQVALVIGIRETDSATGGLGLVLANATMADVRGCEIFINEIMIDHDPDHMSQFTNIPPLMTYNPLGVQATESPTFIKNSLPYVPQMFAKATPGFTTNIPWWSYIHIGGADSTTGSQRATGFRHISHHRFDNYYEFIRAGAGSIGCQITLAGYPSIYPDIYHEILENISLNPVCTVVSVATNTITVDDARGFPMVPYYGNMLEYTDADGVRRTHTYTERSGYDASNMNKPKQFTIATNTTFTNNLTVGTKLRLTRAYDFRPSGSIFTDSKTSIITRMLPQTLQGSRDTNSLHMADAFLCLWHPNLGRPHTFYSDSSRTWLSPNLDRAVDKKPLNSMPEHFETIHYHDTTYFTSIGPFAFEIRTPRPPHKYKNSSNTEITFTSKDSANVMNVNTTSGLSGTPTIMVDGVVFTVASFSSGTQITVNETIPDGLTGGVNILLSGFAIKTADEIRGSLATENGGSIQQFFNQGGAIESGENVQLYGFWPCGSRGGPLASRLDGYGYVSTSWDFPREFNPVYTDGGDDGSYDATVGITKSKYKDISNPTRVRPFGYRFGLRQPYNKPQWSTFGLRALREAELLEDASVTVANHAASYQQGPLIQQESQTWTYAGGSGGVSNPTYGNKYVGIMERQTNFSGMLGVDIPERQVRYSDGMRVTRPFGCPVRTLRNAASVAREWWGEGNNKFIHNLDDALSYYIIDWWGNTRGEDVRRFPVRGFGIKPAWDCADVYEYDRTNDRTPYQRLYNNGSPIVNGKNIIDNSGNVSVASGHTIPKHGGKLNNHNNNSSTTLVDVFLPTNAQRVGDNGRGYGVRYPTAFNEDLLTALNEPNHTTGVVLSHHTAEPNMNDGYIRARDDVLQSDEVPRGISARLAIAEDGLLKPEAVVSDRVETVDGDTPHKDAVSRSSPRIGLDTENVEGVDENMIIINTEAHSLHTDRNVGQRVILQGGMQTGSQTLGDYDLTALNFGGQPQGGVIRLSHTSNFNPLGGTFLAETRNFVSPIDDTEWGGIPTSGMVLWLKADEIDLADGAAVTSWKDASGNGHEFVQATSSKQPTFVLSESSFNNMPAVRFDGGDNLGLPFTADLNTNEFTIFVVPAVSSDTNAPELVIDNSTSPSSTSKGWTIAADMRNSGGANNWEMFVGVGSSSYPNISAGTDSVSVSGAPSILVGQISGGNGAGGSATQLFRVNGTQIGTATVAYHKDTGETYHAGAGDNATTYELNGEIAEIIQFNRALTTTEIQQVEGYLAEKYGITAASAWKSSNPYQSDVNGHARTNVVDKKITYMMRPIRLLDKQHAEMFRSNSNLHSSSPQYGSNYFGATAGGKYGLYVYEVENGKASVGSYIRATDPDSNPPYAPAYYMDISASDTVPMSQGPKIKGTEVTGFDKTLLDNEVTRVIISENSLQHHRADASRRRSHEEGDVKELRMDYSVQPRFSQSLHQKGHKGDVTYNSSDHSGDAA